MPRSISQKEAEISPNDTIAPEVSVNGGSSQNDLEEIRKIIVQPEEVGEVLPAAVKKSRRKNDKLAEATLPLIEENIRQSVQRNPRILAEALFPVISSIIRKAIAEALGQMVQSLNQTLENSLSPQGLKWRIEAMRTGKPFAEVVLLNSLLYRVEQVFLIHKKTGILLQHVSIEAAEAQDGEMVSAMLTAIQDFVHDSFNAAEDATLDSLKVRDLSVWIENSPDAILAAVIRGNAPLNLRETFLNAIEEIQLEQEPDLRKFEGDTSIFENTRPVLQECLQMQVGKKEESAGGKLLTPFNILAGVLGILILTSAIYFVRDYWRWSNYLKRLRNEPGIVVTETERGFFTHEIAGLRDDLAVNPETLLGEYAYDADDIVQTWKPFQDAAPQFVLQRAEKILKPPPTVKLSLENGTLTADGVASAEWFAEAKKLALVLPGVNEFRIGIAGLKSAIESKKIVFNCGTTDYAENQDKIVAELIADLEFLSDSAQVARKGFRAEIEGQADPTGTDTANAEISRARAEKILSELFAKSEKLKQNSQNFKAFGVGAGRDASECAARVRVFTE